MKIHFAQLFNRGSNIKLLKSKVFLADLAPTHFNAITQCSLTFTIKLDTQKGVHNATTDLLAIATISVISTLQSISCSDTCTHTQTNSYLSVTWFKACRQWVRHSISNTLYILTHIVLVKQKISR